MFLSLVNYIVLGLFPDDLDHDYLPSFGIWWSLVIVFSGISGVAFAMLRHQMIQTFKYTWAICVFISGGK